MNRRLQQFMAAENISQSQFADTLGVARASVSHILAGRNKPGFDFIESMARNFPDVNLEWIITGKGKMYKSASPALEKPEKTTIPDDLFSSFNEEELPMQANNNKIANDLYSNRFQSSESPSPVRATAVAPVSRPREETPRKNAISESIASIKTDKITNNQRNILKIVIFYDDNTYQELK